MKPNSNLPWWVVGWLYEHENITSSASNSVEVGAGAELGKTLNTRQKTFYIRYVLDK